MSSPKMKLPSISELTSGTGPVSPLQVYDSNVNNSHIFSASRRPSISASSTSSMSPAPISPQAHNFSAPHIVPSYTQYSHSLESSRRPSVHHNFGPATYAPPAGLPSMVYPHYSYPSVNEQKHAFSVPEVINKPMNECHRCGTTETPEWRRGPNGLRTLCNACGLFHAKLVKKKGAALAAAEVLNNKVYKGKNGRRVRAKKQELLATKPQVFDFPPIPQMPMVNIGSLHGVESVHHHHVPRLQQQQNYPHAPAPFQKPYAQFLPAISQYSRPHMVMSPPQQMPYPEMSMAALRN